MAGPAKNPAPTPACDSRASRRFGAATYA